MSVWPSAATQVLTCQKWSWHSIFLYKYIQKQSASAQFVLVIVICVACCVLNIYLVGLIAKVWDCPWYELCLEKGFAHDVRPSVSDHCLLKAQFLKHSFLDPPSGSTPPLAGSVEQSLCWATAASASFSWKNIYAQCCTYVHMHFNLSWHCLRLPSSL